MNVSESEKAVQWYRGLEKAILSLEASSHRCPVTSEEEKLRHLLDGNKPNVYRVIFRVLEKEKQVDLLHIRHGARSAFKDSQI